MNYLYEHFDNIDCDENGNVFKNGILIKPFHSNGYLQVLLKDKNGNRRVCGVHSVIAMKYLNYYDGCIVHHKDKNKQNNKLENLEVMSKIEHDRQHGFEKEYFIKMCKERPPWNKGMKMSEDFRKKCSDGAKRRKNRQFNGNQYVDKFGNKRI